MTVEEHLCDICHSPLKSGSEVLKVIEQQMNTKGCFKEECLCGVGDGGGENEGVSGIHSILEHVNGGYIRRRCFGHIPWRVCDAGAAAMGKPHTELASISTYLRDGITWPRLQTLATRPIAAGGLGIMTEGTVQFKLIFNTQPPRLIDGRPEVTYYFLRWLIPKQDVLVKLVKHDLATRGLKMKQAAATLLTLQSRMQTVLRSIDVVMYHKGLFLFHYIKKNTTSLGAHH